MNLVDYHVCELAPYPGLLLGGKGPVVLTYLPDQGVAAACGTLDQIDRSCYALQPGTSSAWQSMAPMVKDHCSGPHRTRSHYSKYFGWIVFGQDESCSNQGFLVTETFTQDQGWVEKSIHSPYTDFYPGALCSVLIDDQSIMIIGGFTNKRAILSSNYILNLGNSSWVKATELLTSRNQHGCVVTADGEVMIAGGAYEKKSVDFYDASSSSWRQGQDLPIKMGNYGSPIIKLWNFKPILMESSTDKIWEMQGDGSWQLFNISLGATFNGRTDNAVLVPAGQFKCP